MAIFKIDVQKLFQNRFWTNRYFVEAPTITDARDWGNTIQAIERGFHGTQISFVSQRASTAQEGDEEYIVTPLTGFGGLAITGDYLALFNTIRVDFPYGFRRPYRKFYRGCLGEGNIAGENLVTAQLPTYQNALNQFNNVPLVTITGEELLAPVLSPRVQMRQLRRGTKRNQNPVIPQI